MSDRIGAANAGDTRKLLETTLVDIVEDYALKRIRSEERRSLLDLTAVFLAFGTSPAFFLVGGITTIVAGFIPGILACLIAGITAGVFVYLIGSSSVQEGLSADLTSRAFGFGSQGSILASGVYGLMMAGLFAAQTMIIGQTLLYQFGLSDRPEVKLPIYILLAVGWTVLVLLGVDLVANIGQIATVSVFLFLAIVILQLPPHQSVLAAISHGPLTPNPSPGAGFWTAVNVALGTSALAGPFSADYARFIKRRRDIVPIVFGIGIFGFVLVSLFGSIIIYLAFPQASSFFLQLGYSVPDATFAAAANPGVAFAVLGGALGVLLVVAAQLNLQTLNAYGASLALGNIFAVGFDKRPGRVWCILGTGLLAIVFIFADILRLIEGFMTVGGVMAGAWAAIICTDYYLVRRGLNLAPRRVQNLEALPSINWVGISTWVLSVVAGLTLYYSRVVPVPFVISVSLAVICYTALSFATKGKYSREHPLPARL